MNKRNRVELITLTDGHKIVRLNGNNLHKVVGIQHDPDSNTVMLTLDADFAATRDEGQLTEEVHAEKLKEVEQVRADLVARYADGRIIKFRPFDPPNSTWVEAHHIRSPHFFDFELYEYGLPKGVTP